MSSRLQDVILRGLASARPLIATVAPGTLYFSTDTGIIERCSDDGLSWQSYSGVIAAPPLRIGLINMIVTGGAAPITTGLKGYYEIPFACTIQAVTLLADVSGSAVLDIWKDTYANYPPVVGDSITASAKPTLSSALKSQDTTLIGWNTAIVAGDILAFNIDSVATITKLTVALKVQI